MGNLSRRSVLRTSLAAAAAGTLARPYIANAAATTAEVWWVQGFAQEEDIGFKKMVADYEKASGNKIELSILPFAAMRQKEVAAVTSGVVPDIINVGDYFFAVLSAWNDELVDLTDVIETQKPLFTPTALQPQRLQQRSEKAQLLHDPPPHGRHPVPCLEIAARQGRLQTRRHPEHLGRVHRLFPAGADEIASAGHAQHLCLQLYDFGRPSAMASRRGRRISACGSYARK